jgi:hypothetical protein
VFAFFRDFETEERHTAPRPGSAANGRRQRIVDGRAHGHHYWSRRRGIKAIKPEAIFSPGANRRSRAALFEFPPRPAQSSLNAFSLPIFDTHFHLPETPASRQQTSDSPLAFEAIFAGIRAR